LATKLNAGNRGSADHVIADDCARGLQADLNGLHLDPGAANAATEQCGAVAGNADLVSRDRQPVRVSLGEHAVTGKSADDVVGDGDSENVTWGGRRIGPPAMIACGPAFR
jgi:hypothetical protein